MLGKISSVVVSACALLPFAGCTMGKPASLLVPYSPREMDGWRAVGQDRIYDRASLFDYIDGAADPDICADLGRIWNLPIVREKTRMNVLVVLTPLSCGRGPHHFDRRHVWRYNGLLISQGPVAVDAIGVRLLEAKRRLHFGEERPLAPIAKHVRYAESRHHVGVSDPSRIELVKIGWKEGVLI